MDDPLPGPRYKVGLAYNLKKGIRSEIEDIEAEYDTTDTIDAIREALEGLGCMVEMLEADKGFITNLQKAGPDIVFNIAEGLGGRGREAHIPAILSFLGVPYTGSDETALGIALDKALTKRIIGSYGIRTPKYQLIKDTKFTLRKDLTFPIIIKPNVEGSSKGISDTAVVDNLTRLEELVGRNISAYRQPMLLEEYIDGREFTVGIAGNDAETVVFSPMEVKYRDDTFNERKHNIYSYDVKKNFKKHIEYECPPVLEPEITEKMANAARRVFMALQCRDFSRIDFRMSRGGDIYFIEINPLPGLAPGYSDYILLAGYNGYGYKDIIRLVLNSALKRYGMRTL